MTGRPPPLVREPLFRLLAINLAIGIAAAVLMTGGLLVLDPHGLRRLILADPSGGAAIALLLFGFVITFGSAAMGTAIMAIGGDAGRGRKGGTGTPAAATLDSQTLAPAPVEARQSARIL